MQKEPVLPMVFAHRGYSSVAPENTIPAFEQAIKIGSDGIELDVQLSADEEIIVFHDTNLMRTTNADGKLSDFKFSELKKLDTGSWFSDGHKGVTIPSLEEVFDIVPKNIIINIELKSNSTQTYILPKKVVELIKKRNNQEQILISSFSVNMLKETIKLNPELSIGLLAKPSILGCKTRKITAKKMTHDALHPYYQDVSQKMINKYNEKSKRINTYTVNSEENMRKLFKMGVHGIFTDFPKRAMKIRSEVFA